MEVHIQMYSMQSKIKSHNNLRTHQNVQYVAKNNRIPH